MTVKELIYMVNEEGKDIYQLSLDAGFSKGTLRQRLLAFGYMYDKESGKWDYAGTDGVEPVDRAISYPSKRKQEIATNGENSMKFKENVDLFTALLQLPLEKEKVTNSYKTDKALVERMKTFIDRVSMPSGRLYSLAIYEFLEKYEPIIDELLNNKK